MVRLDSAEQYIRHRKDHARSKMPSIFHSFGDKSSFAVRYFDQSLEHKKLRSRIEEQASLERERKCEELREMTEKYNYHIQLRDERECEFIDVPIYRRGRVLHEVQHSHTCERCMHNRKAQSLCIQVHEWPLSNCEEEAKATMFELLVPLQFQEWREATLFFLTKVLRSDYSTSKKPTVKYTLQDDHGLRQYSLSEEIGGDFAIASELKSHLVTHRSGKNFPVREAEVCLNNGLRY